MATPLTVRVFLPTMMLKRSFLIRPGSAGLETLESPRIRMVCGSGFTVLLAQPVSRAARKKVLRSGAYDSVVSIELLVGFLPGNCPVGNIVAHIDSFPLNEIGRAS